MKIGILTFHSQLNYGGVLQCWALKKTLEGMGYEVVVVDRWLDPANKMLNGPFGNAGLKGWFKILLRSLVGCGDWRLVVRHWRTRKFVRNLGLTPYHFHEWKDSPTDLGIDCLVVGSDQIWHGGDWGDPRPYLLEGAPRVRSIAYAASFGMKRLPRGYDYEAGFKRFASISVREKDGVGLVSECGAMATQVVDPTELLSIGAWYGFCKREKRLRELVCYILDETIDGLLDALELWANKYNWNVTVFCREYSISAKPVPKSLGSLLGRLCEIVDIKRRRVKVDIAAGPREFVEAFAHADACLTNSFHAVMLSCIYDVNVRVLKPSNDTRRQMFGRLSGLIQRVVSGNVIVGDLRSALEDIITGERVRYNSDIIQTERDDSQHWLSGALHA